ncbi:polymorphic toxin-type HINT domain-containing protein [Kitasatospora gansuensis]
MPFGQAGALGDPTNSQVIDSYDGTGKAQYATLTTAGFDAYGRVVSSAGPDGKATSTAFAATGAIPTKITLTGPMGATWATSQTFDPGRSQPLVASDANGRTTTEQYDALGRLVAVWQPDRATDLGANYKFSYSVNGVSAPSVVTSQWLREDNSYSSKTELYDGLGRLRQSQTTTPTGSVGRLISDQAYDSHGWAIKSSEPYYDSANSPNGTIFAPQDAQVPAQTWMTYDGLGRPVTSAFMSYGQQQWTSSVSYPGADRTDSVPPQGAAPSSVFTDGRGQTTAVWQYKTPTATGVAADANITTYSYTAAGQPQNRTDSSGNTWSYTYDLRGRQTSVADPDSGKTETSYDSNSRVASTKDAKGNVLAYSYDLLGRKTGLYANTVAPANQLASWNYDTLAKGRLTSATRYVNGASGSAYTRSVTGYDTAYRPLGTSVSIPAIEGSLAGTYTSTNAYTPVLGLLDHTNLPAMGGLPAEEVDYLYSITGALVASGGNSTLVTDVQYDAMGRPTRTTVGDWGKQVVSTQQYDWATGRVVNSFLDRQTGTTSLDQTSYTYNPVSQITSITDLQNATATDAQCFTYDYLGRLTNAWTDTGGTNTRATGTWTDSSGTVHGSGSAQSVPGIGSCKNSTGPAVTAGKPSVGGPAPYWQSYSYDATGNRTQLVQHDVNGVTANDITTTQTFGAPKSVNTPTNAQNTGGGTGGPHSLLTSSVKSASGTAVATFQYDAIGNTTSVTDTSGTATLSWDGEDKLASVAKSGQTPGTSYLYDADGNQLIRRDPGKTTLNLGSDELVLDTTSPTGSTTDVRYYAAPGGLTITRVTAATGGGQLVYHAADPHGTNGVQISTDATQAVTRRPTDPFGNARGAAVDPASWASDKGFIGGTLDTATGLTNLGAREYDPVHGRFLNPDPLLAADNPQQWNGYSYSGNDPVNSSDPSGLMQTCGEGGAACYGPSPTSSPFSATGGGGFVDSCSVNPTLAPCAPKSTATSGGNGNGGGGNGGGHATGGGSKKKSGGVSGWFKNAAKSVVHTVVKAVEEHPIITAMIVTAIVVGAAACIIATAGGCAAVLVAAGEAALAGAEMGGVAGAITGAAVGATVEGGMALGAAGLASLGARSRSSQGADDRRVHRRGAHHPAARQGGHRVEQGCPAASSSSGGSKPGCNSFQAGVLVLLADGTSKSIEQLTTADQVVATDPQTGDTAAKQVTATITTPDDKEFTDLTLTSTAGPRAPPVAITSTQHHPYWDITTQRWTDAADLNPGDHLRAADGTELTVRTVTNYDTRAQTAYNLTVADLHTYYVLAGTTPVLVHNCGSNFKPGEDDIHYNKHVLGVMKNGKSKEGGPDMPEYLDKADYLAGARGLLDGPAKRGVLEGRRGTDTLRFDTSTGAFGVKTEDGIMRTFFRPGGDGEAYFRGTDGLIPINF